MNPIKDLMKAPLGMVRDVETKLPRGMPKLSATMLNVADAIPDLPNLPMGSTMKGGFSLPRVSNVVKSVEEILPGDLPKLSNMVAKIESPPVSAVEGMLGGGGVSPAPRKAPELYFE